MSGAYIHLIHNLLSIRGITQILNTRCTQEREAPQLQFLNLRNWFDLFWWTMGGSNPRPPAWEIGCLLKINNLAPMELISDDRIYGVFNNLQSPFFVGAELEQEPFYSSIRRLSANAINSSFASQQWELWRRSFYRRNTLGRIAIALVSRRLSCSRNFP